MAAAVLEVDLLRAGVVGRKFEKSNHLPH